MNPNQISEYNLMKMNYDNYKKDSEDLTKLYRKLIDLVPLNIILDSTKVKKVLKRNWEKK